MMSKRKMTAEYLREMVKKSFANVDIEGSGKMCVLPFQSLVDTVNLYEDKLALQEVDIPQLVKENAGLKEQVDEYKAKIEQGTLVDTEAYFIVEENQWAGKNRFLVCQNAIQLAVCDFCETREEAEKRLEELQG